MKSVSMTSRISTRLILTALTCPSKQILSTVSVPPSTASRYVKKFHVPEKDLQTTLGTSRLMVRCSTLYSLFDLSNWLITQHCFIQRNSAVILQNILGVQCSTCKTFFLVLFLWSHLLTTQMTPHPSNKKKPAKVYRPVKDRCPLDFHLIQFLEHEDASCLLRAFQPPYFIPSDTQCMKLVRANPKEIKSVEDVQHILEESDQWRLKWAEKLYTVVMDYERDLATIKRWSKQCSVTVPHAKRLKN